MQKKNLAARIDDEIDILELIRIIVKGKWIIICVGFIFTIAGYFYAKSLPDTYKSEVTLISSSENKGMNIPGQLSGLVALAGVDVSARGNDKIILALEIIKSRDFLGRFIEKEDLYVPLMAAKGWDSVNDKLVINSEIYNEENKQWVRDVKAPFRSKPSTLETVEKFNKILSISQDKISGVIKVSTEFYSPVIAKKWTDKLVQTINEEMKNRDLIEAEKSIVYLNEQIEKTKIADIRVMLFSLIEEQTKTKMLAHSREEYVFKTIDSAVVAEVKSGPKRGLIVVLGFILGLIISSIAVLLRYRNKS